MTGRAPYVPISCSLYDVLEAAAVRGTPLVLVLADGDGRREVHGRVSDLSSRDGAEFLVVKADGSGERSEIRLDALLEIVDAAERKVYRSDRC
jgi:transcriptional antiterminator Rof (Rho-off)